MKRFLIISLLISSLAYGQGMQPFMAVYPSAVASTPIVAKIDFRASGTSTGLTNWNTIAGNPHSSVLTIANMKDTTGANTGWTFSTHSTTSWQNVSGVTSNNSVSGITGGTAMPGASTQSYQSIVFNYGAVSPARYNASFWQFEIGGLDDSKSYTIWVCGSVGQLGFDARNYSIRAAGATTTSEVEIDGGPGGGSGFTSVTTYGEVTLQPSGGIIKIWLNTMSTGGTLGGSPTGSDVATASSMRIKQN